MASLCKDLAVVGPNPGLATKNWRSLTPVRARWDCFFILSAYGNVCWSSAEETGGMAAEINLLSSY